MTDSLHVSRDNKPLPLGRILSRAVSLGASIGFVLASTYSLMIIMAAALKLPSLVVAAPLGLLAIVMAFLIGVLPATIIGALDGLLIAITLTLIRREVSRLYATILGMAVGACLVAIVYLPNWRSVIESPTAMDLLFIGVPGATVILVSGWMGRKVHSWRIVHR